MSDEGINQALSEIGQVLRQQPSVRPEVMRRVAEAALVGRARGRGRTISALSAIAACALILVLLPLLRGGSGASKAFAAAVESVAKVRTFSCHQITRTVVNGREHIEETAVMFKEPERERREFLEGFVIPETRITDYAERRQLTLYPKDKTATLYDLSSSYTIDEKTGAVKLTELSRYQRDLVLKLAAETVKDLGMQKLDGKDVRVLRATGKEAVRTVYMNPDTVSPVQITILWPATGQLDTVASIQIDTALDDSLFSLDVPTGYSLGNGRLIKPNSDSDGKMFAKIMWLARKCYEYFANHGEKFPAALTDLRDAGLSNSVLKTVLAAVDHPDGPPVIVYHRPRAGKEWGKEVMIYEDPAHRQDGKVAAAFADGHAEVMTKEQLEELMK